MARPVERAQIAEDEFYFQAYKPSSGQFGDPIAFPAHITGLTDQSQPSWNKNYDMGRADPVYKYGGFSRGVTISFFVVAVNGTEQEGNYELMKKLGLLTYPIYKSGEGFNACHVYFQVANHLAGIGVITSLDYNWNGEIPWAGDTPRPIVTDATVNIDIIADNNGNRPEFKDYNYNYFGTT